GAAGPAAGRPAGGALAADLDRLAGRKAPARRRQAGLALDTVRSVPLERARGLRQAGDRGVALGAPAARVARPVSGVRGVRAGGGPGAVAGAGGGAVTAVKRTAARPRCGDPSRGR